MGGFTYDPYAIDDTPSADDTYDEEDDIETRLRKAIDVGDLDLDEEEIDNEEEKLVCSKCGAEVQVIKKKGGRVSYRCPVCKKFVKVVPRSARQDTGGFGMDVSDEIAQETQNEAESAVKKGQISEADVVGGSSDPAKFLEEFLSEFKEIKDSFIRIYCRRYGRLKTLPSPQTLVADLLDMGSGISNKRYASFIGDEYAVALEAMKDKFEDNIRFDYKPGEERVISRPYGTPFQMGYPTTSGITGGVHSESSIDESLDRLIDRQSKMQLLQMIQSGYIPGQPYNGGQNRSNDQQLTREDIAKMIEQSIERVEQRRRELERDNRLAEALDNLNRRLERLENWLPPAGNQNLLGGTQEDPIVEQVRSALGELLRDRLVGKRTEITPETIRSIVEQATSKIPRGQLNEYDMQVQVAKIEAEAKKAEAAARRQGYSDIANAIREGMKELGWGIGAGAAEKVVSPKQPPARYPPHPLSESSPAQGPKESGPLTVYENGDMWGIVCEKCGDDIIFPKGQARVICKNCGAEYFVQPHDQTTPTTPEPEETEQEVEEVTPRPEEEEQVTEDTPTESGTEPVKTPVEAS